MTSMPITHNVKPITLRTGRAFALLEESVGKFKPRAGRNQNAGKSFRPKYDFYRPATMLIDHLSYLYDIGNKDGERSVWERLERLFVENGEKPIPFQMLREDHPNIEGIDNLRWMVDRALQIRLKNYMAKENQGEEMILLDEFEGIERKHLIERGLDVLIKNRA